MSVLSWFDGKEGPEYETARWVHDQIEDRIRAGDVVGLAGLCAAIKPIKGVFCGIMLGGFQGRDEVVRDAFEELRNAIRTMPDEVCERVFAIVERGDLPIHFGKRRDQFDASRETKVAMTIETIRTQLASTEPELLVMATSHLLHKHPTVFDLPLAPTLIARADLADLGLARLRELVSALPDEECWPIIQLVRERRLPIDTKKRADEIARHRNLAAIASDAAGEPRNRELEAALASNVEDPTNYEVLGDFLQRLGHPRGELIALQLRAETDGAIDPEAYLDAHADAILGSLAAHRETREPEPERSFTWRRGFIDRMLLAIEYCDRPEDPKSAELLRRVFAHPAGRLIRSIHVTSSGHSGYLDELVDAIATHQPGLVGEVLLDVLQRDQYSEGGSIAALWNVPSLRSVRVRGVRVDVGTIDHPRLERADFTPIAPPTLRAIARARWPRIEQLELGLAGCALDDVRTLLARTDLPALVDLGLYATTATDELCRMLATSPVAARLTDLDLSYGSMTDHGARTLTRSALPMLERLVVSANELSPEGVAVLLAAFPDVVAADQAEPDPYGDDDDD